MKATLPLFAYVVSALARYSLQNDSGFVRLTDGETVTIVSVMPTHGNMAFGMTVKGKDILRCPYKSDEEFKSRPPAIIWIYYWI